jgi:hypothetical protein
LQLPFTPCRISCAVVMLNGPGVPLFVHKCMKFAGAAAVAAVGNNLDEVES